VTNSLTEVEGDELFTPVVAIFTALILGEIIPQGETIRVASREAMSLVPVLLKGQ